MVIFFLLCQIFKPSQFMFSIFSHLSAQGKGKCFQKENEKCKHQENF